MPHLRLNNLAIAAAACSLQVAYAEHYNIDFEALDERFEVFLKLSPEEQQEAIENGEHPIQKDPVASEYMESWQAFVDNPDLLLDTWIKSGAISDKEAVLFHTDKEAWLIRLREIYEDMKSGIDPFDKKKLQDQEL